MKENCRKIKITFQYNSHNSIYQILLNNKNVLSVTITDNNKQRKYSE